MRMVSRGVIKVTDYSPAASAPASAGVVRWRGEDPRSGSTKGGKGSQGARDHTGLACRGADDAADGGQENLARLGAALAAPISPVELAKALEHPLRVVPADVLLDRCPRPAPRSHLPQD